uniref:Uncharacterized protein n=1 Tax=Peronospora matthiolae TaxID=2874970 RepID=A0AAV1T3U7_9STRA
MGSQLLLALDALCRNDSSTCAEMTAPLCRNDSSSRTQYLFH